MPVIVQFDFPFSGPFGVEMHAAMKDLAASIAQETGFLWKIWTEDAKAREAGGIYLFKDRASADAYVAEHTARLGQFGITGIRAKVFDVNTALSAITKGPTTG